MLKHVLIILLILLSVSFNSAFNSTIAPFNILKCVTVPISVCVNCSFFSISVLSFGSISLLVIFIWLVIILQDQRWNGMASTDVW